MDKRKSPKLPKKTPPSTPQITSSKIPSCSVPQKKLSSAPKKIQDYSNQVENWIHLFRHLNRAIEDLFTMCSNENFSAFTDGVIETLEHSLEEFQNLRQKQSGNTSVDISDPSGSVDGELLRQYLDDGLSPVQALVLLIRERAAEDSDEIEEESWEELSVISFDSEKRCKSLSPGRVDRIRNLEAKLFREKPSPGEVKQKIDDKQKRAEWKRSLIDMKRQDVALQKQRRMRKIKEEIEKINEDKKRAIELQILLKQSKADERYEAHLSQIRNRAKSENLKPNEVAFILELQAEDKKMTIDQKIEDTRERRTKALQSIKQKQVERIQKEEAAEKRRLALQSERGNKLMSAKMKLEEAENRRIKILEEKKTKAEELGKRGVERTYRSSIKSRDEAEIVEEKENESWDSSSTSSVDDVPKLWAYRVWSIHKDPSVRMTFNMKKGKIQKQKIFQQRYLWCSVCNYEIPIDSSPEEHINSDRHQDELRRFLVQGNLSDPIIMLTSSQDLEQQRDLYVKKRMKKLKQMLSTRCQKHEKACIMGRETSGVNKNRIQKLGIDFEKCIANNVIDYGQIDNILKDTIKILDQRKEADLHVIRQLKFIPCLMEIIKKVKNCPKHEMKYILGLLEVGCKFIAIFSGLSENRTYMIITNRLIPLVDLVCWILEKPPKAIMELTYLSQLFHILTIHLKHRLQAEYRELRELYIDYLLNCGLLSLLRQKLHLLQRPLDLTSNNFSLLLLKCVGFLESLNTFHGWGLGNKPAYEVSTFLTDNFIYIFKESELAGIPYLLLCLLLNDGPPKQQAPRVIPQTSLAVSILSMRFLNNLARLHLPLLQEMLSSEEYYDQMYHLFNYILRYCTEHIDSGLEDVRELLHEVILLIGYFVTQNTKNQDMMNLGETSILQRLCGLPFAYFTDKKYTNVLFPSLISICYKHSHNLSILQQEMSVDMLSTYITQQCQYYPMHDPPIEEEKKDVIRSKKSLSISSSNSSSKSILAAASLKLVFTNRFPRYLWESAAEFFQEN